MSPESRHTRGSGELDRPSGTHSELVAELEKLTLHDHLCLIYETREEQLAAAIPFIRIGLDRGEQCVYVADDNEVESILAAMRGRGIDTCTAIGSGALRVVSKREAYLQTGAFDPEWMIGLLRKAVDKAREGGFHALRVTGEMTWALGREPGTDRLIEYEAKLNHFFPEHDILAICQYNRSRFDPGIIQGVISTHPIVIYGSLVCRNPYYIPPDELLGPGQAGPQVDRMLKNLTDLTRAEESLRRAGPYTRSLIEAALDPLVTIGTDGRITDVNAATETVTGCPREALIGTDFSDYFTEPERAREGYRQVFREGSVPDYALEIRHRGGRVTPVLYNASVYRDGTGEVIGVFAAARDITEQKKAEAALSAKVDELARSNRELEEFAYVASHDLQEPLRMISSFTQLLSRRYRGNLDAEADEYIGYVVDGANRMQRLINDLLAYSRVGTRGGKFERTDCTAALGKALENLMGAIEESGAAIVRGPLPTLAADSLQLIQVFQNLVGNAIKFRAERPPEVRVAARKGPGGWVFSVKDNGIGIDPKYFDRIFDIFQRLHGKAEYAGSGIGLAICRRIVERHGGRIWVESAPGEGAAFLFSIPAKGGNAA